MIRAIENCAEIQFTEPGKDTLKMLRTLPREELQKLQDWLHTELRDLPSGCMSYGCESGPETLTPRETEVLILIASGYTRREAGLALSISECTAASHVKSVYRKLDVSSIAEATFFAVRAGMVR